VNLPFYIAKDDGDFIKVIFFLVILAIVGISKLIQKFQENSRKNQARPPRPQPQKQQPPPTWRANEDEVRKFLDQMERHNKPQSQSAAPPVISKPRPIAPSPTFQRPLPRDTGESSVAEVARELLQSERLATHVERSPDAAIAADAFAQPLHAAPAAPTSALARTAARAARTAAPAVTLEEVRKELRDRASIQRAFVLSEILSPPRGLQ